MFNGKSLKRFRKEKHLTLKDLAQITGYTPAFLSQLETGKRNPSLKCLRRLADCLSISMVTLIDRDKDDSADKIDNTAKNTAGRSYKIIKKEDRVPFSIPGLEGQCEFITPPCLPMVSKQFLTGTIYYINPKSYTSEGLISHIHDECIFILSGNLQLHLEAEVWECPKESSIYIYAGTRHNLYNHTSTQCIAMGFNIDVV